ncbi:MAG: YdcF family protein [Bacteriovoracales bacterium]|jgi:uncharacterized SAM-binding protein YcdF (DUF218 family)
MSNFKKIYFSLLTLAILSLGLGWFFVRLSIQMNEKSKEMMEVNQPDLIAVFTGDRGRIPMALKVARKYKKAAVFITGVDERNKIDDLIEPFELDKSLSKKKFEIDYLAKNTIENVISTLRYLQKNPDIKNILIISHDYHILRISLIMKKFLGENNNYQFYYSGIPTKFSEFRNIRILSKEILKWIRTYFTFWIWSPETL